jgi:hypothetical protein
LRAGLPLAALWIAATYAWSVATDYTWKLGSDRDIQLDGCRWVLSEQWSFGNKRLNLLNWDHEYMQGAIFRRDHPGRFGDPKPPPPPIPFEFQAIVNAASGFRETHRAVLFFGETETGWLFPLVRRQWWCEVHSRDTESRLNKATMLAHLPGLQRGRVTFDTTGVLLTACASCAATSILIGAVLLRSARRARHSRCVRCAYELLKGQSTCPECGTERPCERHKPLLSNLTSHIRS